MLSHGKNYPHFTFTVHPLRGWFLHFAACGVIWPT